MIRITRTPNKGAPNSWNPVKGDRGGFLRIPTLDLPYINSKPTFYQPQTPLKEPQFIDTAISESIFISTSISVPISISPLKEPFVGLLEPEPRGNFLTKDGEAADKFRTNHTRSVGAPGNPGFWSRGVP